MAPLFVCFFERERLYPTADDTVNLTDRRLLVHIISPFKEIVIKAHKWFFCLMHSGREILFLGKEVNHWRSWIKTLKLNILKNFTLEKGLTHNRLKRCDNDNRNEGSRPKKQNKTIHYLTCWCRLMFSWLAHNTKLVSRVWISTSYDALTNGLCIGP